MRARTLFASILIATCGCQSPRTGFHPFEAMINRVFSTNCPARSAKSTGAWAGEDGTSVHRVGDGMVRPVPEREADEAAPKTDSHPAP